jgi:hypothetical protein
LPGGITDTTYLTERTHNEQATADWVHSEETD